MATATFTDTYAGKVAMQLKASRTTRAGKRVETFKWVPVTQAYVTTGMPAYTSAERAVAAAGRDVRFADVVAG